ADAEAAQRDEQRCVPGADADRELRVACLCELFLEPPEFLAALVFPARQYRTDRLVDLVVDQLVLRNEIVGANRERKHRGGVHQAATRSSAVGTPSSRPSAASASKRPASIGTPSRRRSRSRRYSSSPGR